MSAFLGNIHFWLYNKIQAQENLLEEVISLASTKGAPVEDLKKSLYERFGAPVQGDLADEVDQGNIHGWLQEKIHGLELRSAAAITSFLKEGYLELKEIEATYYQNGKSAMENIDSPNMSPSLAFKNIYDILLEGMPCDRVNQVISDTETEFSWRTTQCLHKDFWTEVSGDVSNFYTLRNSWIKGFLEASKKSLHYSSPEDGLNQISIGG